MNVLFGIIDPEAIITNDCHPEESRNPDGCRMPDQIRNVIVGIFKFRLNKASKGKRLGFTLLEVLIAMTVASIGLLSMASLQCAAVKGNTAGCRYTQATFLAQNMLERLKDGNIVESGTFGFMDMSQTKAGVVLTSGMQNGIDEESNKGGPFNLSWQIYTYSEWSRKLEVSVTWNSILGVVRNVRLFSISRGNGN